MRNPLFALIWKDVKLFSVDRQALVMSLAVPVLIASILGWLDISANGPKPATDTDWAHAAHDFAGFGLQGLLFFATESAVGLGRERRQGIWRRLRSAPISPDLILAAKWISAFVLALVIILLVFAIGIALFRIRPYGTTSGFALMLVASALMTAAFALLMATIGTSEAQSRAVSILLILVMLATGGAWFPMERMPDWVQAAAKFLPVRWAVEGFDAATWGKRDFAAVAPFAWKLVVFAVVFVIVAGLRFRFSNEPE